MSQELWRETTLGGLAGQRGKSINPAKTPHEEFELYSVPSFPTGNPEMVTGEEIGSNKQIVEPDSVLLCKINPRINRAWVVGDFSNRPKIASTEWIVFPPKSDIAPHFLCYFFQQDKLRDFLSHNASGVGGSLMRVKPSTIRDYPFAYPRLSEQVSIVAEIEKQFTRLEAGVAALKRVQANLKRYRAAVLKAACEGKLVPTEAELARAEGRKYETGAELLERILEERRKNWKGRGKYNEPSELEDAKFDVPYGWATARISQLITEPLCNGISIKGSDEPPGIRALRLSAMSDTGFDYSDARYLPLAEKDVDDLWIQDGDFFMSRGNGSLHLVGRGTSAQLPPSPTIFPDTMIRIRLNNYVRTSGWVRVIWQSRLIRSQIEGKVKTTAGIYKIAQPQVEQITFPFPPLAEQKRIVEEVERRLSVIEEMETAVQANLLRASRLRQAVLQRAFSGKLTNYNN